MMPFFDKSGALRSKSLGKLAWVAFPTVIFGIILKGHGAGAFTKNVLDFFTKRKATAQRLQGGCVAHQLSGKAMLEEGPSVTRKVWKMPQAGRLSRLELVDEELPYPGKGEVRVAVKAVGLNFADIFAILGLYGATPEGAFIPGLEFSGQVEAVGEGVENYNVGDRIYGFTRFGAYVSHINSPECFIRHLPNDWSFEEGASFLVQGLTAWHGLVELGALKKGQTVLVQSAAGGVGLLAVDICTHFGAEVFATVGSPGKVSFLSERCALPTERIIVREKKNFKKQLETALESSGVQAGGFDVVMESLGGSYFKDSLELLTRGGRMVTFGSGTYMSTTDGPNWLTIIPKYLFRPKIDPGDLVQENRNIMGFNLIWLTDKVTELNEELDDLLGLKLRPPHVGKVFQFEQAKEAVDFYKTGNNVGKIVLVL